MKNGVRVWVVSVEAVGENLQKMFGNVVQITAHGAPGGFLVATTTEEPGDVAYIQIGDGSEADGTVSVVLLPYNGGGFNSGDAQHELIQHVGVPFAPEFAPVLPVLPGENEPAVKI